jgi:hypothetical protein
VKRNWTYSDSLRTNCKKRLVWPSPVGVGWLFSSARLINAGGMVIKPVVISQMKRADRRLCHSGTVPKPSSICIYGDKPPFG